MGRQYSRCYAVFLMADPIETKLSAACTKLILDRPFLGALVLRMPMVEASEWCTTTATDAKSFFYNREYIDALSLDGTQFMLAHDAMHCALLHFSRRQHRDKHRWDIACDYAVNPLLINDGLNPPQGALYMKDFEGMTAEEIYPLIDDSIDKEPVDQHLYDQEPGDDDVDKRESQSDQKTNKPPPPLTEQEREALALQWQQRMAGAAQTAMQAGKLDGAMARMIDHLLQPQLPWRMLLSRYVSAIARDDYSYARPSSRREEAGAIHPTLRSSAVNLVAIVDTSGSVGAEEMAGFISEINAIKGQMRARVTLHACDNRMDENGPWVYEAWEEMQLPEDIQGGRGTNFCPAIEWVNGCEQAPDLLLYFTDAQGSFPEIEPSYPVLWLVKGKSPVPWGQRVQLN